MAIDYNALELDLKEILGIIAGDYFESYPDYWADCTVYEKYLKALLETWYNYVSVVRQPAMLPVYVAQDAHITQELYTRTAGMQSDGVVHTCTDLDPGIAAW